MTRLFRWALLLVLLAACAPTAKVSSGPGSSPTTRMYRVNALAFEAPAPFSTRSIGLIEALVGLPSTTMSSSRGSGVTLTFCAEPDIQSCGALGVRLRNDFTASQCADRDYVREWLGFGAQDVAAVQPATFAERSGWLVAGGPAALRTLLLCDGAQFWMVKAVAIGDKGEPPARTAFDLFLRTVRFEAAAATAAPSGG